MLLLILQRKQNVGRYTKNPKDNCELDDEYQIFF